MKISRIFTDKPTNWVEDVWRKNASQIYKLCQKRSSSREAADDLFQEVALKFCKSAPTLNDKTPLKSWLRAVTLNTHYSIFRKKDLLLPMSRLREEQATYEAYPEKSALHFCDGAREMNARRELKNYMEILEPIERMIIELNYIGEISMDNLVRFLGISKSQISKIRTSALKKMRQKKIDFDSSQKITETPSILLEDLLTRFPEIS